MLASARREQAVLDGVGPGMTDAFDLLELGQGGPHDLLEVDEPVDDPLDDGVGEPGQAVEEPVATGLDRRVGRRAARSGDGGSPPPWPGRAAPRPAGGRARSTIPVDRRTPVAVLGGERHAVVADHELEGHGDAVGQLGRLQPDQSTVLTELDQVAVDLLGDPQDHLGRLHHPDDVADRHGVLDLEDRETVEGDVEAAPETLHGGESLIGAVVQPSDRLDGVFVVVAVDGDHRHRGRHRDDRDVDRSRHPLGGPVAGAGLGGWDRRVGHEMDVRPRDARSIGGDDDRAVHLRQLGQALRAELRIEQEPSRADGEDPRVVAEDDERTTLRPEDAIEPVTQRLPRCRHERARR